MIIYNVTTNIDDTVHEQWLKWMQEQHIPEILATGLFSTARLSRVMVDEEMGGTTYSVQYTAENREALQRYYTEHAPLLREKALRLFADKMIAFRTELEVVSDH